MKNELTPWEVGLAEQVKGKEFSFDPQAFADFENLLEAETLGQEPGQQAPDATGEIMSASGTTFSLPMVFLAIGLACLAGWWFLPGEAEGVVEPAVTTSVTTAQPAPTTSIAPAAPPTPTVRTETNQFGDVREIISSSPGITSSSEVLDETTGLTETMEEAAPRSPRIVRATNRLATLPFEAVASLERDTISWPAIQQPAPKNRQRNRKALFPDVIKKN